MTDLPARLSNPARRALTESGRASLESLAGVAARDLLALHGVGPSAIPVIDSALAEARLTPLTRTTPRKGPNS